MNLQPRSMRQSMETSGREAVPPGSRSRVWADRSKVPRKTPASGWPGSVSTCLCDGSACHPAWGSPWGAPRSPRMETCCWRPAGTARTCSTRDSGGQRGALGRALRRRTQEEDSGGALTGTLRGSTQEGHSGGCPLSSPATLSWALGASLPASEFDGLAPFDRSTDGPCMSCPPWRPCHPIAQQRQVTSPQRLASKRTSISTAFSAASQA